MKKSRIDYRIVLTGTFDIEHADDESPLTAWNGLKKALSAPSFRFLEYVVLETDPEMKIEQRYKTEVGDENVCPACDGSGQEDSPDGERTYLCSICGGSGNMLEYVACDGNRVPVVKKTDAVDERAPF